MISSLFDQMAFATGLAPIVSICALVILSLSLLGILVLIKIRSISKALSSLNNRLDHMNHRIGWQSGESEILHPFTLGSPINNETAAEGRTVIDSKNNDDMASKNVSEKQPINAEIYAKIYELLKKSARPTPYQDLTKHLSKEYPGYNYDFFLREVEDLRKEGKVEVEIIAGKLYLQLKKS